MTASPSTVPMSGRLVRDLERLVASAALTQVTGDATGGYRAIGQYGRLLVVLPGLVGPSDVLASLAMELGQSWRCCFVTYPRVPSLTALVEWLEEVRRREGGGVAHVYGGSFGGLVAQAWLRQHPERIGHVVLSGTGPPEPARAAKNARTLPWLRRMPMPVWRLLLRLMLAASTIRAEDRAYWRRYYGQAVAELTRADIESRYRISIGVDEGGAPDTKTLACWHGRMLVLEGGRDPVARQSVREALRRTYAAATFHTFPEAGHGPALERPDEWLRVVTTFLSAAP